MKTKTHTSLSEMPRNNAFSVPEGYFEELPTAVLAKCSDSKVKIKPLRAAKPLWWSVAACSLLLLGIWFVVPDTTSPSDSLLSENELLFSTDLLNDYLAHFVCPTIIEDELFAENIDFTLFLEDLTDDDFWDLLDDLYDYDYLFDE